jgi:hypothetical protein
VAVVRAVPADRVVHSVASVATSAALVTTTVPVGPDGKKTRSARAKAARRRNIIVAAIAVFIMITGIGFVGGTYYVDSVEKGDALTFPDTTTLYYSDGVTVLAKLGVETR